MLAGATYTRSDSGGLIAQSAHYAFLIDCGSVSIMSPQKSGG
jgi:hypothetical protein